MDINRVPNEKKLYLSRWYFRVGFCFLPFVWLINVIWFYKFAFKEAQFDEQAQIKKYVIYSGIGAFLWFIVLATWIVIFQTNRVAFGEFADEISFIIPLGSK